MQKRDDYLLDSVINKTFFNSDPDRQDRIRLDDRSVEFLRSKYNFLPGDVDSITCLVLKNDNMLFDVLDYALQKEAEECNEPSDKNKVIAHAFSLLSEYNYIFSRTRDAYSYDRYGTLMWLETIRHLDRIGYTNEQIIEIMKSKHVRWAADTISIDEDICFYPMRIDVRDSINNYFETEKSLIDSMLIDIGLQKTDKQDAEINVKITPDTIISIAKDGGIEMSEDDAVRVIETIKKDGFIEGSIAGAIIEKIAEMNIGTIAEPSL